MGEKIQFKKVTGHEHGNLWDDHWLTWRKSDYLGELPPLPVDYVGDWTEIAFAEDGGVTWLTEDQQGTEWWQIEVLPGP